MKIGRFQVFFWPIWKNQIAKIKYDFEIVDSFALSIFTSKIVNLSEKLVHNHSFNSGFEVQQFVLVCCIINNSTLIPDSNLSSTSRPKVFLFYKIEIWRHFILIRMKFFNNEILILEKRWWSHRAVASSNKCALNPTHDITTWFIDAHDPRGIVIATGLWQLMQIQINKVIWTPYFKVFENYRKSRIQHCERSELRFHFEWTAVHTKCQKWSLLASFWKLEASGQTVLPDRSLLIGQKLVEKAKIEKLKNASYCISWAENRSIGKSRWKI